MVSGDATVSAARPVGRARTKRRPNGSGAVARFLIVWVATWWVPLYFLLPPLPGRPVILGALAAAALGPIPFLLRAYIGRRPPSARVRLFVFRPFWYLQLFMPLAAVSGIAGAAIGLPWGAALSFGSWTLSAALFGLGLLGLIGYRGTRQLVVRSLELGFDDLPPALDGLRVVQLSDLHVGPHTPRSFLRRVAASVVEARPDLLVVTGDQVDDFAEDVDGFVAAFGHLRAPLGVYAVAGNHDVYAGWPAVRAGLEATGIIVLENEAVPLTWGGSRFWLAGTGDPAGYAGGLRSAGGPAPDIRRTLAAVPAGGFVVALAHNPALWPALAGRGVQLTLSGHTHHGQFAIPRLNWSLASLFLRHALGIYREGNRTLYINPGTNYWSIPFRVGALPEITVVTLRGTAGRTVG